MVSSSYDFGMNGIPFYRILNSERIVKNLYANNILDPVIHYRR